MTLTYAQGHELLDRLVAARRTADGDRYTELFAEAADLVLDPFTPALVGHNALRAYLIDAAETQRDYDLAIERHWVSGATVLAAWHASWNRRLDDAKIRQAGFLSAEVGEDGRITRLKHWTVTREHLVG